MHKLENIDACYVDCMAEAEFKTEATFVVITYTRSIGIR